MVNLIGQRGDISLDRLFKYVKFVHTVTWKERFVHLVSLGTGDQFPVLDDLVEGGQLEVRGKV